MHWHLWNTCTTHGKDQSKVKVLSTTQEVSPQSHLWGGEVMMICSISSSNRSENVTSPISDQNSKRFDCRSKETTQWYSSLLQNGAVPESNDVQCVRLQAPMATGICRHLGRLEELTGRWFQAGSSIVPSGYLT